MYYFPLTLPLPEKTFVIKERRVISVCHANERFLCQTATQFLSLLNDTKNSPITFTCVCYAMVPRLSMHTVPLPVLSVFAYCSLLTNARFGEFTMKECPIVQCYYICNRLPIVVDEVFFTANLQIISFVYFDVKLKAPIQQKSKLKKKDKTKMALAWFCYSAYQKLCNIEKKNKNHSNMNMCIVYSMNKY